MDLDLSAAEDGSRGEVERPGNLHRDQRAQILPLVFFLGVAFFTSVVLVINTGRSTVGRMKAQNAVDAAAVSGATTVARGMNYVSSNNITISKALAMVVILRAFPNAIEVAETTLDAWTIAAKAMHAAANTPWTAWLHAVATVIEIKVEIEEVILEVVGEAIKVIAEDVLGVDDEDNGVIWLVMKGLHYLGVAVVWATPVLAQVATNQVYSKNIAPEDSEGWLLPIYPAMPACEEKFGYFYDETRHWVEEAADPIYIAGWIALTLSLFPLWYQASLEIELQSLFTGEEGGEIDQGEDPELEAMKDIQKQIDAISAQMADVRNQRTQILSELVALAQSVGLDVSAKATELSQIAERIQYLQADQAKAMQDPPVEPDVEPETAAAELQILETRRQGIYTELVNLVRDRLPSLEDDPKAAATKTLDGDPDGGITDRWQTQKDRLEDLQSQLEDLDVEGAMGDRLEGGMPDDFDGSMGDLEGDAQDRDWPHPWRLDPSGYPGSFSYLAVGYRTIRNPIVPVHYKRQLDASLVYAAARVYNSTRADLWTADWRARLVKTELSMLENPLGSLPSECGDSEGGSGASEMDSSGVDTPSAGEIQNIVSTLEELFGFLSKH